MRYALDNGCDYVFLLNQDAWILPDTLKKLISVSEQHPEFGILSPMHMNAEFNKVIMAYYDGHNNVDLINDLYNNTVQPYYLMRYINAAAWLMTRATMENVGGFCPMFFQYGEDDDYLNRAYFHKIPLVLCPHARVVHDTLVALPEQRQCHERAEREQLYEHLDINKPFSYNYWRKKYIKRYVRSIFSLKLATASKMRKEYMTLKQNRRKIEKCRIAHKLKQPNWLT